MFRRLPCGCSLCGCLCADHSPTRTESACPRHVIFAVIRWIVGDAAALVALALFCVFIAVAASAL